MVVRRDEARLGEIPLASEGRRHRRGSEHGDPRRRPRPTAAAKEGEGAALFGVVVFYEDAEVVGDVAQLNRDAAAKAARCAVIDRSRTTTHGRRAGRQLDELRPMLRRHAVELGGRAPRDESLVGRPVRKVAVARQEDRRPVLLLQVDDGEEAIGGRSRKLSDDAGLGNQTLGLDEVALLRGRLLLGPQHAFHRAAALPEALHRRRQGRRPPRLGLGLGGDDLQRTAAVIAASSRHASLPLLPHEGVAARRQCTQPLAFAEGQIRDLQFGFFSSSSSF
mmetsp:Transcript_14308/g.46690  ORF Transcript_14308/g.46690 Transcript_14308/m.46690 type:complete len:278 (+) Transcript_14308:861-1694(+)